VIRFESLIEDGNYLLKFLQRNEPEEKKILLDETSPSATNNNKTANAFKQVSDETLNQLTEFYSSDFNIMGYAPQVP